MIEVVNTKDFNNSLKKHASLFAWKKVD